MTDILFKADNGNFSCFPEQNTRQLDMFDQIDVSIYPAGIFIWEADFKNKTVKYTDISGKKNVLTFTGLLKKVDKSDTATLRKIISGTELNENNSIDVELRIIKKDDYRWYKIRGSIHSNSSDIRFGSGVAFDIDGTKEQLRRMEYLRTHDYLTGLASMVSFYKYHTAKNCIFPQALIVADIDNLKEINDTLGYRAGNTLIKSVAEALSECFFDAEMIMRAGGGEFCAVFSGKDDLEIDMKIKEAGILLHRMYMNLIKTEVSFGYSVSDTDSDIFNLYGQAVRRMRRNKNIKKLLTKQTVVDRLNEIINRKAGWGKRHIRLQSLSSEIAHEMGCSEDIQNEVKVLAKIAGLGFAGLDDRLLKNRNSLSGKDVMEYMKHIEIGRAIIAGIEELEDMEDPYMDVYKRYDEWKEGITISGRILAGAAGFDDIAYCSRAERLDKIISMLEKERGIKYCPKVLDVVLKVIGKPESMGNA